MRRPDATGSHQYSISPKRAVFISESSWAICGVRSRPAEREHADGRRAGVLPPLCLNPQKKAVPVYRPHHL